MATSSSKKKNGSAKKPAAAPKKQPAKKQPAAAPTPAPTAPTWPYAIVCIVLSLLAFLGLFHAEGVIIDGFAGFLSGIMGWGYWAFPFAMLLLAWVFVRNPERHFGLRVTASLLIAPLFGTIVHLMVCRVPFTAQTFGAIVGQLYDGGKALTSGGVISGGVGYLLKAGISVYAALPLTMAAFVACVLGSMDLTVGKIVTWWRAHREAQYIPDDGDQHGALTALLLDGGLRLVVALFSQNKSPFRADRFRGGTLAPRRPAPTRCYKYRVSAQCGYPMG